MSEDKVIIEENSRLIKYIKYLFLSTLIMFPFNGMPYFDNIFGELHYEGYIYPIILMIICIFICILKNRIVYIPENKIILVIMCMFWCWMMISLGFNIISILDSTLKGRSGISKAVLQVMVTSFYVIGVYAVYFSLCNSKLDFYTVRKWIAFSFIIVGVIAIIEIMYIFDIRFAEELLKKLNVILRGKSSLYSKRIRSVSGEASWLAMYCSFVFPWLLTYMYQMKKNKDKVVMMIFMVIYNVIVILSQSRTFYVIHIIQVIAFIFLGIIGNKAYTKKTKVLLTCTPIIMFALLGNIFLGKLSYGYIDTSGSNSKVSSFIESLVDKTNMSNIARYGSMVTAINVGNENKITGVGIGQFGFYANEYSPEWALKSDEIKGWSNNEPNTPWPTTHNLYLRLYAEIGSIGLGLWIIMIVIIGIYVLKRYINQSKDKLDLMGLSILISMIGVILSGFNFDSLRYYGNILIVAISVYYINLNGNKRYMLGSKDYIEKKYGINN